MLFFYFVLEGVFTSCYIELIVVVLTEQIIFYLYILSKNFLLYLFKKEAVKKSIIMERVLNIINNFYTRKTSG